jgi:hypothetical protein
MLSTAEERNIRLYAELNALVKQKNNLVNTVEEQEPVSAQESQVALGFGLVRKKLQCYGDKLSDLCESFRRVSEAVVELGHELGISAGAEGVCDVLRRIEHFVNQLLTRLPGTITRFVHRAPY